MPLQELATYTLLFFSVISKASVAYINIIYTAKSFEKISNKILPFRSFVLSIGQALAIGQASDSIRLRYVKSITAAAPQQTLVRLNE